MALEVPQVPSITQAELDKFFTENKPKVAGKIVLMGAPRDVNVNFNEPAKRLDDKALEQRLNPRPRAPRPNPPTPRPTPDPNRRHGPARQLLVSGSAGPLRVLVRWEAAPVVRCAEWPGRIGLPRRKHMADGATDGRRRVVAALSLGVLATGSLLAPLRAPASGTTNLVADWRMAEPSGATVMVDSGTVGLPGAIGAAVAPGEAGPDGVGASVDDRWNADPRGWVFAAPLAKT